GLDQVESTGANPYHGDGGRIDQRKQAAEAIAKRLTRLSEGLPFRPVLRARNLRQSAYLVVRDIVRHLILADAARIAPNRIITGIGPGAAMPPATPPRPARLMARVAELAPGRRRRREHARR